MRNFTSRRRKKRSHIPTREGSIPFVSILGLSWCQFDETKNAHFSEFNLLNPMGTQQDLHCIFFLSRSQLQQRERSLSSCLWPPSFSDTVSSWLRRWIGAGMSPEKSKTTARPGEMKILVCFVFYLMPDLKNELWFIERWAQQERGRLISRTKKKKEKKKKEMILFCFVKMKSL